MPKLMTVHQSRKDRMTSMLMLRPWSYPEKERPCPPLKISARGTGHVLETSAAMPLGRF
jgi:hypothetical protein